MNPLAPTPAADSPVAEREAFLAFVTDAETEDVVRGAAEEMGLSASRIVRGGIEKAIGTLAHDPSAKLLVVDIADSELPLSDIHRLADVCEEGTTLIVVGERNDVGLFRELVAAGAADYLVKPLTVELLSRTFQTARNRREGAPTPSKLGRLVAVIGARGGVGATTVAVNAAWLLAEKLNRRVALVDLDTEFGTAALALDLQPRTGLREALEQPGRIDALFVERVMLPYSERLSVLATDESNDGPVRFDQDALDLLMAEIQPKFHYVVVDLPRSLSALNRSVLHMASVIVIVTDLSLAGLRDCMRILGLLAGLSPVGRTLIVANRVGEFKGGEIARAEFEKTAGRAIDFVIPFEGKNLAASVNRGEPVVKREGQFTTLLAEVVTAISGSGVPAKKPFWARWLR